MPFLNLGIVAHVDAGKTSLTERLLYAGGVIDAVGSVDAGTTRTDSLDLERRRGITIKTAVASFPLGGRVVNLIDTPGHPDFIAEVERALRVLDGAVLVISAVEGVQAQTRVLLRTLRRLRVPTLIFVNKIDRAGARYDSVLDEIATRLTPDIVPVSGVRNLGTPQASAYPLGTAQSSPHPPAPDATTQERGRADVNGGPHARTGRDGRRGASMDRAGHATRGEDEQHDANTDAGTRTRHDRDMRRSASTDKAGHATRGEDEQHDANTDVGAHTGRGENGRQDASVDRAGHGGGGGDEDGEHMLAGADAVFVERLVDLSGDSRLLADWVRDESSVPYAELRDVLRSCTREASVYPVFFGSAVTGAGVDALLHGLVDLLPLAGGDSDGPLGGTVFKIERDRAGARVAYVRMVSGTLKVRDRTAHGVVTAIEAASVGSPAVLHVSAGQIAKVHGLRDVRIGDAVGTTGTAGPVGAEGSGCAGELFAPPTVESVVVAVRREQRRQLHTALSELAEQDPLINLRYDERRGEAVVSLYGEVQKEVLGSTLAEQYGIDVVFRGTTVLHVERPAGRGRALEVLGQGDNPYLATLELTIEPGPAGGGLGFALDVPIEQVPIHLFKTEEFFRDALEDTVRRTLAQGLRGWPVIDVRVRVTRTGYVSPATGAGDFRKLLPLVVMSALSRAGTVVCEPVHRFRLDGPAGTLSAALGLFGRYMESSLVDGPTFVIEGRVPVSRLRSLESAVPGLTHGEGVLEATFDSYRPVPPPYPARERWDDNPLDRWEYLLRVERRLRL